MMRALLLTVGLLFCGGSCQGGRGLWRRHSRVMDNAPQIDLMIDAQLGLIHLVKLHLKIEKILT